MTVQTLAGLWAVLRRMIPAAKILDFYELKEHKPCFDKIGSQF